MEDTHFRNILHARSLSKMSMISNGVLGRNCYLSFESRSVINVNWWWMINELEMMDVLRWLWNDFIANCYNIILVAIASIISQRVVVSASMENEFLFGHTHQINENSLSEYMLAQWKRWAIPSTLDNLEHNSKVETVMKIKCMRKTVICEKIPTKKNNNKMLAMKRYQLALVREK